MNNWINVPDLKRGDVVIITAHQGPCRVEYVVKNAVGDYIVGYWTRKHELWEKTFLAATSLQKADKQ